jgi:hypothetical protein
MSGRSIAKTMLSALIVTSLTAALTDPVLARDDDKGNDESRVAEGFRIAPVQLNLHGKNHALVGLGSYLVNGVGGCNDCHTWPNYANGGDPYQGQHEQINTAGYLAGGRVFFGPIVSRNLTPDHNGLPAGQTLEGFFKIIRTGRDPDQAHPQFGPLLQVMPWPVYRNMTDRDIHAIYEYLRSIPCVEGDPGSADPTAPRC